MRRLTILMLLSIFLLAKSTNSSAQPIPVEWMMGNNYGVVNLVFNKRLSPDSRFGFFHMNTVQFYYQSEIKNSILVQNLLYVEAVKNLRVAGGVVYSNGGFNTTAGIQYIYSNDKFLLLVAPRVNIEASPSYDLMTIFQYKPKITDKVKLFTRCQMLNLRNNSANIKSYQWLRVGLEVKGVQFGLAANFDEFGPKPTLTTNFGVFLRKEIL